MLIPTFDAIALRTNLSIEVKYQQAQVCNFAKRLEFKAMPIFLHSNDFA